MVRRQTRLARKHGVRPLRYGAFDNKPWTKGIDTVKKTIAAGALVISLFVVGCDNNSATPSPTTEAQAVESMAAEEVQAAESAAAEEVEAVESMAAEASMAAEEVEGAVESTAAEEVQAVESMAAEASPAA
jgi:PBP1b-binding outer membrane lipoprotein LpoB